LILKVVVFVAPPFHFIAGFLLMPPYTGYFICGVLQSFQQQQEECPNAFFDISWTSLPIRLLSGSFASVTAAPASHRAATAIIVDVLFGTLSVCQFLELLQRVLVTGKRRIMLATVMKKLTEINLLLKCYNRMYADLYYSNTLAIGGTALITFAVGAINLRREIPLFGTAFLAITSICGLLFICVSLAAAGRVRLEYKHLIRKVKADEGFGQSRLLRKIVKSSAPLKVRIGSVNFVDRATAGVYLMFSVEQIGSLALIK
jgi:hypothetical protein